jgi:hypothetical protein
MNTAPVRSPRPTVRELLRGVVPVVEDLPLFLTAPLYRRWHLRWGATPQDLVATVPGDELLPNAQFRSTRAITIAASPVDDLLDKTALLGLVLMEFGDFAMMRRMLYGIKDRAEALQSAPAQPGWQL